MDLQSLSRRGRGKPDWHGGMSSIRVDAEIGSLRQGLAAVDDDRRSGDVGRVLGGEEERAVGDVARSAEAAQRHGHFHRPDEGF